MTGNDGDSGDLYGLGNQGGVYVISTANGQATLRTRLNVALAGTSFGVDFNPAIDRLRVISDTGQNLAANVDTGVTAVNTTLTYPPATTPATGVTGAAYTNNRRRPEHRDDAVRHRLLARPGGDPVACSVGVSSPRPASWAWTPTR